MLTWPSPRPNLCSASGTSSPSGKLSQAKAATLLGLDQPKVSALVRGRVEGYSIDRLFRFLNALGQRVEITVRPNPNNTAACAVVVR